MERDPMEKHESETSAWEDIFGSAGSGNLRLATADTYLDAYRVEKKEEDNRKFLAFFLGKEEYAVELPAIKEILKYQAPTFVPRTKPFVLGVISVRGEVLPIIDLKLRMDLGETLISGKTRILVAEHNNERFGLTVDSITSVEVLPPSSIQPPPITTGRDKEFIEGIGRIGDRLLILTCTTEVLDFGAAAESEAK